MSAVAGVVSVIRIHDNMGQTTISTAAAARAQIENNKRDKMQYSIFWGQIVSNLFGKHRNKTKKNQS